MQILLINYMETTRPGGINKAVLEIAQNLSKKGHNITVLQTNPFNLPDEEYFHGFKIIRIKSRLRTALYDLCPEIYSFLKKNLKSINPDLVHIHGYQRLFPVENIYLIRKLYPDIPLVVSPHFDVFSHDTRAGKYLMGFYNNIIGKKVLQYPDRLFAASNFEARNLMNIFNIPPEKIVVIAHGVNIIQSKHPGMKKETIHLVYAGYLLELKGIQHIIQALNELIYKRKVKACLTIIGEGPYKAKLIEIARKWDVSEFINWRDFIPPDKSEELLNYFRKSDVLLLLSQSENYGIVVSEALALGTPVIVTDRTALSEFLNENGCFGVAYPPRSKDVVDLILKIINNNIEVGPLTSKIRLWADVAGSYEDHYLEVVENHRKIL